MEENKGKVLNSTNSNNSPKKEEGEKNINHIPCCEATVFTIISSDKEKDKMGKVIGLVCL